MSSFHKLDKFSVLFFNEILPAKSIIGSYIQVVGLKVINHRTIGDRIYSDITTLLGVLFSIDTNYSFQVSAKINFNFWWIHHHKKTFSLEIIVLPCSLFSEGTWRIGEFHHIGC